MTNRAAQNLGLLDAETDRLLATCRSLSATDLHRSTLCAGWDAAHLLTHLARNADALSNLVLWATDGMKRPAYASTEQRDNDIRTGARRSHEEILTDVETTAVRFRELADALKGKPGDAEVRTRTGTMVKGHQVVAMRTLEVVFHHVDLQAGYNFDNADPSWLARMLRRGVGQWEASGNAPTLTLTPVATTAAVMEPLHLSGGGPDVAGTPGQLLRWLARGSTGDLSSTRDIPSPPAWA